MIKLLFIIFIKKTNKRKTLKYEEQEKRRIQGKSNNKNKHLWFYFLYKKIILCSKRCFERGYLKRSNDTPKPKLYGLALVFRFHDLRPKIHINRLGTTKQIFIAMDYLIPILE